MNSALEVVDNPPGHEKRARAARVSASRAFLQHLQARTTESAAPKPVVVDRSRFTAELTVRLGILRRLAQPRTELPVRLNGYRFFRNRYVKALLLRIWNYASRPSRTQTQVVLECIELIGAELERADDRN